MTRTLLLVLLTALMYGCLTPQAEEPAPAPKSSQPATAHGISREPPAPVPLSKQAQLPTALTLAQAFELADRSHPEIPHALAQLEAAGGRTLQTGALPNPSAIARIESAPLEGRTTAEAEYVAGVSQRLPLGSRLSAASRAGRLEEERLRQELAARRLEVHRRVQGAFATALYLDEVIQVETRAVQIAENGLAATSGRLAAGDALPEDVARAEMELERARLELMRTQSLREQAQAELRAALGDPSLTSVSLEGALETTLELPTIESLSARLGDHPLVTAAEADLSVQLARVDLAQVQRIPNVNLDLFYRRLESSHTNSFDFGIAIPLPLFDRNQGNIRETQASVAAADARSRSTRNELERELRQAHTRLASALADARVLRTPSSPEPRQFSERLRGDTRPATQASPMFFPSGGSTPRWSWPAWSPCAW